MAKIPGIIAGGSPYSFLADQKEKAQAVAAQYPAPPELGTKGNTRLLGWLFNRLAHGISNPTQTAAKAVATMTPANDQEMLDLGMNIAPMGMGLIRPPHPIPKPKWNDEALNIFGRTYNPKEAGYLLRKGQMVDFSGRNQGAGASARGQRYLDHRDIWQVGENLGESVDMVDFMDKAQAVRMSYIGDDLMLDVVQPPANIQLNRLSEIIKDYRPENIYLDITNPEGRTLKSIEINRPTYAKLKKALEEHYGK